MMNACSVHYLHFYIVCDPLKGNDTTYSRHLADLTSINLTKTSPNGMLPKKLSVVVPIPVLGRCKKDDP